MNPTDGVLRQDTTTIEAKTQYVSPDLVPFLQRPDSLIGQKVDIQGRIFDVEPAGGETLIILEMETPWGGMPNEVAISHQGPLEDLTPGQELRVWGHCLGTHIHASHNCGVTARTHVAAHFLEG